ncbi:MAG: RDD family protein [Bacteroidota bacterium]
MEFNFTIARFWSRIAAILIDITLLGILGFILGFSLESFFVSIGPRGNLFGMAITMVYFGIFNSKLLKGQTVGKMALMIKVIDKNGDYLSVQKSFLRAILLCLAYFIFDPAAIGISSGSYLHTFLYSIMFSFNLGLIVVYIFNKGNRQSLHDIFMGTFVVRKKTVEDILPQTEPEVGNENGAETPAALSEETVSAIQTAEEPVSGILPEKDAASHPIPTVSKYSLYIAGGLAILVFALNIFFFVWMGQKSDDGLNTYVKLSKIDGVMSAGVNYNTTTSYGKTQTTTKSYGVTLWVKDVPDQENDLENNSIVREAIITVLKDVPDIDSYDILSVTLVRGFDIGIAKGNRSYNIRKTPAHWRELLIEKYSFD